jgi:sulfate/thiosulfate transport system substrate-binding protein
MGKRELRLGVALAMLSSVVLTLYGCGGGEDTAGGTSGKELDLVTYSDLEAVYTEALEPAFRKALPWESFSFDNSFGDSRDQSLAVAEGEPASIVHFEQAGEMERLVNEGKVDPSWDEKAYNGIGYESVIVFIVRPGNPKQIHSVGDILERDVDVVTPNPFRSNAGRWNVMNVYATLINERHTEAEALAGVKAVLEKTVAQPDSATEAFELFREGKGDVLFAYESDAIRAVDDGKAIRFIVPHQTTLVETPIAVTEDAPQPAAEDFLKFLWSEAGQLIWAENGYRPVNPGLVDQERFFPRQGFRMARFGGWAQVNEEFFDPETGSIAKIERELDVPISE